jgi:hypothetical protein
VGLIGTSPRVGRLDNTSATGPLDEIAGGHLPMLSGPAKLAKRLVELFTKSRP